MPWMPEDKSDPLGVAVRQLLAIAGAFSLLGLIKDVITWQYDIGVWIDAFRAFSRPIASFLFGWIPALFHLGFPAWLKDYLTVGLITLAATIRASFSQKGLSLGDEDDEFISLFLLRLLLIIIAVLFWPIVIVIAILRYNIDDELRKIYRVFAAVYVYAIIIIALNYAFIVGGAKTGA